MSMHDDALPWDIRPAPAQPHPLDSDDPFTLQGALLKATRRIDTLRSEGAQRMADIKAKRDAFEASIADDQRGVASIARAIELETATACALATRLASAKSISTLSMTNARLLMQEALARTEGNACEAHDWLTYTWRLNPDPDERERGRLALALLRGVMTDQERYYVDGMYPNHPNHALRGAA